MKLRQIAEEITDDIKKEYSKGFEYNAEDSGYGYHEYSFSVGDAKFKMDISGADCRGGGKCKVHIVSFEDVTDGMFAANRQGSTGRGNVKEVFSTVVEIIKDFISKNPGELLMFDGDEGSRAALYNRFAKGASNIIPGYVGITDRANPSRQFLAPRNKVEEALEYIKTSHTGFRKPDLEVNN